MASTGSASALCTTIDRPARCLRSASVLNGSGSTRWLGMMWSVCSNQKLAICVRTTPLSGIGVGRMTSNAESRSLVTISIWLGAYS